MFLGNMSGQYREKAMSASLSLESPRDGHAGILFNYAIRAMAAPQTICRVTGLFAQFGLIPKTLKCECQSDMLVIDVELECPSHREAELMRAKVQTMVVVEHVELVLA